MWISLDDEMSNLINGSNDCVSQGSWNVLRIFRRDEHSEFWDENRKESIGGPAFKYDDYLIKMIVTIQSKKKIQSDADRFSQLDTLGTDNYHIFAIAAKDLSQYTKNIPKQNDVVYSIKEYNSRTKPVAPLHAVERYLILNVITVEGNNGDYELFYLIANNVEGEY